MRNDTEQQSLAGHQDMPFDYYLHRIPSIKLNQMSQINCGRRVIVIPHPIYKSDKVLAIYQPTHLITHSFFFSFVSESYQKKKKPTDLFKLTTVS